MVMMLKPLNFSSFFHGTSSPAEAYGQVVYLAKCSDPSICSSVLEGLLHQRHGSWSFLTEIKIETPKRMAQRMGFAILLSKKNEFPIANLKNIQTIRE